MPDNLVKVAIVGFGTVGAGVAKILLEDADAITAKSGLKLELAAVVENAHRLAGHDGAIYLRPPDVIMARGPLASGPNLREISGVVFSITGRGLNPAWPTGPSRRVIQAGDLVLIDIPPCVNGYHADQTRMYCAGRPPEDVLSLYDRLLAVADYLILNLRPGLTAGQAYLMAETRAGDLGLGDSFMRFPSGARAHFVGHGLGLELNEPPLLVRGSGEVLRADMVLTVEMHVMETEGYPLKIEDTILLTVNGARLLTKSPREMAMV